MKNQPAPIIELIPTIPHVFCPICGLDRTLYREMFDLATGAPTGCELHEEVSDA